MSEVLSVCSVFLLYAVAAVFAENAVFSRALGVSRLVKLVGDSTVDTLTFGGLMCAVQLLCVPLAKVVNDRLLLGLEFTLRSALRPLAFILCSAVAFGVVLGLVLLVFKAKAKDIVAVLPMATFNTAVLGAMLLTVTQSFTWAQTMGYAVGSGAGYTLAVVVVTESQRKLRGRSVPAAFKGLPITLIYIGILAMAIYAFTGHRLAI